MFDDSKRLDKLESQMAEVLKALSSNAKLMDENTRAFNEFDKNITKRLDDAITQINTNDKSYEKRLDSLEKLIAKFDGEIKKLQQRCANLEVTVKKMGK
jgi:chromosome segregation ATPase